MNTKRPLGLGKLYPTPTGNQILISDRTWKAVIKLADELREKKVKIGFFSSTPQGGRPPLVILHIDTS